MTPWTVTHQAPLSVDFSRQEYWIGLLFPPPRNLPDPGIKPMSPALQADSLPNDGISLLIGPCFHPFADHNIYHIPPLMEIFCGYLDPLEGPV